MPQNRRARAHHRATQRIQADRRRQAHWAATDQQPARPARPRRLWPSRAVGALALLAAVLEAVALVWLLCLLPGSIGGARQYRSAPSCPQGTTVGAPDCVVQRLVRVVEAHPDQGRGARPNVIVEDLTTRDQQQIYFARIAPVLDTLAAGQEIRVASWRGQPVSISASGLTQRSEYIPTDLPGQELAGLFAAAMLLPATIGTGRRLLRLRDPDPYRHTELILFCGAVVTGLTIALLPGGEDLLLPVLVGLALAAATVAAGQWDRGRADRLHALLGPTSGGAATRR
jgi:hypothetical protein